MTSLLRCTQMLWHCYAIRCMGCRRDAIKSHLHKDYASLCASHVPVTTSVFGEDLQSRLNNIRASNRISRATVVQRFDKTSTSSGRAPSGSWSNRQQKGPSKRADSGGTAHQICPSQQRWNQGPNRPEVRGNNTRFKSIKVKQFESTYATGNQLFHAKCDLL